MREIQYVAITTEDGEVIGYFDLITNEVIKKDGFLTWIGFGKPKFTDKDGKVYLDKERRVDIGRRRCK